jgi:hypothetical protein
MKAIEPIIKAVIEAGPDRFMFGTGMLSISEI